MNESDHERRITRLELMITGSDDHPQNGMASRLMMTESVVMEMKSDWRKIQWLMIIGILTAVLNLVISSNRGNGGGGASQSTSVITGDASKTADSSDSPMTYLTTEEMATKAGVAPRTILSWIPLKRFEPAPTETAKGWIFDAECRILPPNAADSGIAAAASKEVGP